MKILSKKKPRVEYCLCNHCDAILEFSENDIKNDEDSCIVICPECKKEIVIRSWFYDGGILIDNTLSKKIITDIINHRVGDEWENEKTINPNPNYKPPAFIKRKEE